ncbi:MAG: hypothetical protein IPH10_14100 [bacterium]|nr:hypothetical protein [bacterium]
MDEKEVPLFRVAEHGLIRNNPNGLIDQEVLNRLPFKPAFWTEPKRRDLFHVTPFRNLIRCGQKNGIRLTIVKQS